MPLSPRCRYVFKSRHWMESQLMEFHKRVTITQAPMRTRMGIRQMRIHNLRICYAPDMVLGDIHFDVYGGVDKRCSRIDRLFDALVECLYQLDRGGVHTFSDPEVGRSVELRRRGEKVLLRSGRNAWLPDGWTEYVYAEFRADVLAALLHYLDRLFETWPLHPETARVGARLEALGVFGKGTPDRSQLANVPQ